MKIDLNKSIPREKHIKFAIIEGIFESYKKGRYSDIDFIFLIISAINTKRK